MISFTLVEVPPQSASPGPTSAPMRKKKNPATSSNGAQVSTPRRAWKAESQFVTIARHRQRAVNSSEGVDGRKPTKFNPLLPYEAFYRLLFFVQWAVVCRTEDVVDCNTVVR